MDNLSAEAVTRLRSELLAVLGGVNLASLKTTLFVVPTRVAPIGLGGFVSVNEDPLGDVVGRQVDAMARVNVGMPTLDGLGEAVTAVSGALLTLSRKEQADRGFQKIALDSLGPVNLRDNGGQAVAEREVIFSVRFEHLKKPEAAEDIIRAIPIQIGIN